MPQARTQGHDPGDSDGDDSGKTAIFQAADHRGEQEREGQGEGEGDEQLPGEVEHQDGDGEHNERLDPGEFGAERA